MHHIVDRDTFWDLMLSPRSRQSAEDTLHIGEHTYHCNNPPDITYIMDRISGYYDDAGLPPPRFYC